MPNENLPIGVKCVRSRFLLLMPTTPVTEGPVVLGYCCICQNICRTLLPTIWAIVTYLRGSLLSAVHCKLKRSQGGGGFRHSASFHLPHFEI